MQIRLIYQASCRNDPTTLAYVRWLAERGGEVRTRPSLPMMLVVVDREVAFVPRMIENPAAGALEVRDPSLVAALVDWFTGLWEGAEPLGDARRAPEITAQTRRELLRLMASGLTDEAAGRRLGLSGRTVRRSMADIMAELGAASRFQAGVAAQRRGWLDAAATTPASVARR
jgi:DNA-binding CsgD family transcriptional regulator